MRHFQNVENKSEEKDPKIKPKLRKLAQLGLDMHKGCEEECIRSIAFK